LAPILITLAKFIVGVESGMVTEVFSATVGSEKRIYGKSPEGCAATAKRFNLVYAVVP
jgi:hypothetical protein